MIRIIGKAKQQGESDNGTIFGGMGGQSNFSSVPQITGALPGGSDGKESACNAGDPRLIPGSGRFPCRKNWQATPVFLSG